MKFDGVLRNRKPRGDFFIGQAISQHLKYFTLARRKLLGEICKWTR
jgi:hypothetical protein